MVGVLLSRSRAATHSLTVGVLIVRLVTGGVLRELVTSENGQLTSLTFSNVLDSVVEVRLLPEVHGAAVVLPQFLVLRHKAVFSQVPCTP